MDQDAVLRGDLLSPATPRSGPQRPSRPRQRPRSPQGERRRRRTVDRRRRVGRGSMTPPPSRRRPSSDVARNLDDLEDDLGGTPSSVDPRDVPRTVAVPLHRPPDTDLAVLISRFFTRVGRPSRRTASTTGVCSGLCVRFRTSPRSGRAGSTFATSTKATPIRPSRSTHWLAR